MVSNVSPSCDCVASVDIAGVNREGKVIANTHNAAVRDVGCIVGRDAATTKVDCVIQAVVCAEVEVVGPPRDRAIPVKFLATGGVAVAVRRHGHGV